MRALARLLRSLPLLLISPLLVAISALALLFVDVVWKLFGRPAVRRDRKPSTAAVSVVIPNWNGRDLLEKYLPSVETALAGNPANEIVVVDNGSSDGSAEMLREKFPRVKVLALERNLGFGGGSNAGFRAAANDVVVLLNSDMRVEPDFLAPLLEGFSDERVFAVSCQILFAPDRLREETGLTQGWWEDGQIRVRHRNDPAVTGLYPCFYGGGGSCAFDRRKFLELGGFDPLFEPFYMEDTDLGYLAWKRGWKVLYQPQSVVFHEHRGTIGKRFRQEQIDAVLNKNYLLFCWKNIHETPRLAGHFFFAWAGVVVSALFGEAPPRPTLDGLWRAFRRLPRAVVSRWRARGLAAVSDTEALLRPLGGYFRDCFEPISGAPERPRVLFVSPYPICPPVHGGGVFMYQTLRELARLAEVHVLALLDHSDQLPANQELGEFCASTEFLVRMEGRVKYFGSIVPHAVREFQNDDLAWLVHRQIYTRNIDVVQLEYTPLAQYLGEFHKLSSILFEHDIYFQSIARALEYMRSPLEKIAARFEYLRALHYELRMLRRCDRVQVCTVENRQYLESFLPSMAGRIQPGLRAGIDTTRYRVEDRCPAHSSTMLFLGGFRHAPNQIAVDWFVRQVLPRILRDRPEAKLVVVGPDPPPAHAYADFGAAVEFTGFVEDIREPLAKHAVFLCPIRNGSGVRVKLLEAFAAGIPVVSTRIGAEGLARVDGEFCLLADDPDGFAERVLRVLAGPEETREMVLRARTEVEQNWDMARITRKLVESYRDALREKRGATVSAGGPS
ncbi:MAG: glycosyltransferase [Acidobacteria bacterium]|nr:glycosyltransferase [Acidobacteriota bacterium]